MNVFWRFAVLTFGVLVAAAIIVSIYLNRVDQSTTPDDLGGAQLVFNNQIINLEAARTPAERGRGLSERPSMPFNHGLLFLFEAAGNHGFWMKDMKFPIDIVWLIDNRVAGLTPKIDPQIGAKPSELKVYYPPEPVNRVLELNSGRAELLGVKAGDRVTITGLSF